MRGKKHFPRLFPPPLESERCLERKRRWPEDVLMGSELFTPCCREHHSPSLMTVTSVPPRCDTCCSSICCRQTLLPPPCVRPTNPHQPSSHSSSGSIRLDELEEEKEKVEKKPALRLLRWELLASCQGGDVDSVTLFCQYWKLSLCLVGRGEGLWRHTSPAQSARNSPD